MNVLASPEDERAVLGAMLLSESIVCKYVVEEGLRAEHFYSAKHAAIFAAMVRLLDQGEPADVRTIAAELKRSQSQRVDPLDVSETDVDALAGEVPVVGNLRSYARRVRELSRLRAKQSAAHGILAAVDAEDLDALADAEGQLHEDAEQTRTFAPEQLADEALTFLQSGGGERWSLPWLRLTKALAGGIRRGTVTVIGGHSSHGKSAASDDIVDTIVGRYGVRATVYINEMTRHERVLRYVARRTGLDLGDLMQPDKQDFGDREWRMILEALSAVPWSLVEAEGWTADEIARHMRVARPDVALIDIFQLISTPRGETRDWDQASRVLNAAAKQANCALIVTAHLNEARAMTVRPKPVLGDIRNTGALKNDADNVIFVWRDQEPDGSEVLDDGVIYIAKARMGVQGVGQPVVFDGRHMRFIAADAPTAPRSESDVSNPPTEVPF